jgi:hypothetical protein
MKINKYKDQIKKKKKNKNINMKEDKKDHNKNIKDINQLIMMILIFN